MHDKTKEIFLREQDGNPKNQQLINTISAPGYEFIPNMESKRFIKTHLPFSLMPLSVMNERAKVVYVARNPKDVIVSYYHLSRLYRTTGYVNDFEQFWNYFENDLGKISFNYYCIIIISFFGFKVHAILTEITLLVAWSPYWEHIKEGYAHRHEPNVLFMYYEDMNKVSCSLVISFNYEFCPSLLLKNFTEIFII